MRRNGRRALVIGGSIGGLFAALILARRGWDATVFERTATPLTGRGAGIVTHPEFSEALAAAGLDPREDLGVLVERRRTLDPRGRVVAEQDCRQTMTSWDRLYGLLRGRLPPEKYRSGHELAGVDKGMDHVTARFADGTAIEGDLLVGADGIRSTVRSCFLPAAQPVYAGYVAWRGLVDEADLSQRTCDDLFAYFAFCLPPGEQMLGYPVAGPADDLRPGHRRYNFVWYRPAHERGELPRLLTDAAGRIHSQSIPPPLIHPNTIRDLRAAAAGLAPQFEEIVRLTSQPFLQPIYDFATPRMQFGRVALLGDAAFVARPHVGAGVAKAAHDAIRLADELESEDPIEECLVRFETARLATGHRIVARGRELGAYMQAERKTEAEIHFAERYRVPDAVMADTALLDFLRR